MSTTFASLLAIAGAPILDLDAPLPITVTRRGRQTLRAHDAPVPTLRRRTALETVTCGLCGEPVADDAECDCDAGISLTTTVTPKNL